MAKLSAALLGASLFSSAWAAAPDARTLAIDERLTFMKRIERVDARYGFDPADTAALAAHWSLSPTDEALTRQLLRMAREVDPRGRLVAIYEALGNDSFVVKECLARPALVDRLSRDLFAFDPGLHAKERAEAETLRRALVSGELDPRTEHPGREVFRGWSSEGDASGDVSSIREDREAFVVFVTLSRSADETFVARYVVPKRSYEEWRESLRNASPGASLPAVAGTDGTLPMPAVLDGCAPAHAEEAADLFVLTYGAPVPVTAGELLTYTVILRNEGPDTASDTEMLLLLSDATTFRSIVLPPEQDWQCVQPPVGGRGKVSCTNKCFPPHVPAFFTIMVAVDACTAGAPITTTTIASSATSDPFPPNNFAPTNTPALDPGGCDDANVCTTGDRCEPIPSLSEDFDGVATPFLPAGWTATLVTGPVGAQPWQTTLSAWDTRPHSAFAPDAGEIRDMVLDSPEISIRTPTAELTFQTYYSLELNQDGGVLEVRIGGGPFMDILEAGGSFVEGGYNGVISNSFGSPIANREAWTGTVSPFTRCTVRLPAAAAGRTIVLRWRLATDRARGLLGQWIDSIVVNDRRECRSGPPLTCDDGDACTADSCDAVAGCRNAGISCDDGVPCTTDVCNPYTGCAHLAPACDDGNPCTDDTCSGADCAHANNTAACDDGDVCTLTDVCSGGVCAGSNAVVCRDVDVCTADSCDPMLRCVAPTADFDGTGFSAGRVDGRDLAVLAGAWNSCPGNPRYAAAANLDRDGICIDLGDFHRFMDAFGRACP